MTAGAEAGGLLPELPLRSEFSLVIPTNGRYLQLREEVRESGNSVHGDADWEKLTANLFPRVRRVVQCRHTAEDLTQEAVWRTWRAFRCSSATWPAVRACAVKVAKDLVATYWRTTGRRCLHLGLECTAEEIAESRLASPEFACEVGLFLARLRKVIGPLEQQTLSILAAGIFDADGLASARGVGVRAARKSRAKLRRIAVTLWKSGSAIGISSGLDAEGTGSGYDPLPECQILTQEVS